MLFYQVVLVTFSFHNKTLRVKNYNHFLQMINSYNLKALTVLCSNTSPFSYQLLFITMTNQSLIFLSTILNSKMIQCSNNIDDGLCMFVYSYIYSILVYLYKKPMQTTFQTIIRNVCLSLILEFCLSSSALSSVYSLQPTAAYVEVWNIHQKLCMLSQLIL